MGVVVLLSCSCLVPNEKPKLFLQYVKTKRGARASSHFDYFLMFSSLIISRYLLMSFFFR